MQERKLTPDQWRDLVEGKRSFIPWIISDKLEHESPMPLRSRYMLTLPIKYIGKFYKIFDRPGLWQPWFPEWEGCPFKEGEYALIMLSGRLVKEAISKDEWEFFAAKGIIAYQVLPKSGSR